MHMILILCLLGAWYQDPLVVTVRPHQYAPPVPVRVMIRAAARVQGEVPHESHDIKGKSAPSIKDDQKRVQAKKVKQSSRRSGSSKQKSSQKKAIPAMSAKKVTPPEPQKLSPQKQVKQDTVPHSVTEKPLEISLSNSIVGQSGTEKMGEVVHEAISATWRPPRCVRVRRACIVQVFITPAGRVGEIRVVQSSGILAFDIPARHAVSKALYPRSVWGKEIIIQFS